MASHGFAGSESRPAILRLHAARWHANGPDTLDRSGVKLDVHGLEGWLLDAGAEASLVVESGDERRNYRQLHLR